MRIIDPLHRLRAFNIASQARSVRYTLHFRAHESQTEITIPGPRLGI
jgi:hypothetical protein